ncbi:MAG: sugar phosphate permease [Edaphobacter sp.]|nr:sugar phosphate permease [Edaphobacter sp.]
MLWAAWFAEYEVLYTYQIFFPTIRSADGHSIVNSFRYSVVIYSAAIPGYVLEGMWSNGSIANTRSCSHLLRSLRLEHCLDTRNDLSR